MTDKETDAKMDQQTLAAFGLCCFSFLLWFGSQGIDYAPAVPYSQFNQARPESKESLPFGNRHGFAVMGEEVIPSRVVYLYEGCGPATVARFIIPVIVDTINAVEIGWTRPHVGVEVLKRHPTIAHADSSTAVIFVRMTAAVVAPFLHRIPDYVFGAPGHSVRCACSPCRLSPKATAALRVAFSEARATNDRSVAAGTSTVPVNAVFAVRDTDDCQSAKYETCQVFEGKLPWCRVIVSHEMFLCKKGRLLLEPAGVIASARLASF